MSLVVIHPNGNHSILIVDAGNVEAPTRRMARLQRFRHLHCLPKFSVKRIVHNYKRQLPRFGCQSRYCEQSELKAQSLIGQNLSVIFYKARLK